MFQYTHNLLYINILTICFIVSVRLFDESDDILLIIETNHNPFFTIYTTTV